MEHELGFVLWAGLVDDPFFFDAQGFEDTLATESLSFTGTDAFEGRNVMAIVLESPPAKFTGVRAWASTSRL